MDYENGDIYIGEMRDGDREGQGKYMSCDTGIFLEGMWKEDQLVEDPSSSESKSSPSS
jgi:hypothetical protein